MKQSYIDKLGYLIKGLSTKEAWRLFFTLEEAVDNLMNKDEVQVNVSRVRKVYDMKDNLKNTESLDTVDRFYLKIVIIDYLDLVNHLGLKQELDYRFDDYRY